MLKLPGDRDLAARRWRPAGDGPHRPVLALHGWMDHADSFAPIAPALTGCDVVALDLPGHGFSSLDPGGDLFHFIDNVWVIHQALTALDWDQVHLLGHSMGAGLATLFAAAFSERVLSLVSLDMVGPVSSGTDEMVEQLRKGALARAARERRQRYFATRDEVLAARHNEHFPLALCEMLADRGIEQTERGWTWRGDRRLKWASLQRYTHDQVTSALAAVTCPTLIVIAEINRYPQAKSLFQHRSELIARSTVVTLPGSHHLHMEYPDKCAQTVLDFYTGLSPQTDRSAAPPDN